jgi:excisionase family DNA binding protein
MSFNASEDENRGPQQWFTPAEAARYLRVSRQTIYRYMEQELLLYYELKSGGGRRLRRSDLDALLERPTGRTASDDTTSGSE